MVALLLFVIYLSYISIGLPDSLLGAAWPSMQPMLHVPLSHAGYLSMIISCGTVLSSLCADRLLRRFGTGPVVSCSVLLTALALYGFSAAESYPMLCLSAVPYGLGAGAVDAALNHYVAVHYAARHMNWLHCFWGIGAAASPYIMSYFLHRGGDWQGGYHAVAVIQFALTAMLFLSLPLWRRHPGAAADTGASLHIPLLTLLRTPGVAQSLVTFFIYCAAESTIGLWAGSYLVHERGAAPDTAARFASFFFIGMTLGRLLGGFLAERVSGRGMIRLGLCGMGLGLSSLMFPLPYPAALCGMLLTGLGCAPIYPALIRETALRYGAERAQSLIGMQMASAYLGTTLMPSCFGLLSGTCGMRLLPFWLFGFLLLIAVLTSFVFRRTE
ncbi:MAG: MFS transporter [Oscillospiraceae bacterium]|nr:MFS transporter [Oscillospiraceae bacterium]